ncbi:MAG TPA: TetR/AcrR family transcriptional regulator [Solirubrobacteraceae bacterium]|nr:TetR/AcrR family transcriptional regulator [Solirubrobacteraceae bacterium]
MATRVDGRALRYQHRRGELLEAVAEYVLEHGVANLTLRRVAEAVGVSHVTLQHHFGTKETLVGEIVEHLLDRTFTPRDLYPDGVSEPGLDMEARLRGLWQHLASPNGQRDIRLFLEVLAQSHYSDAGYAAAVRRSIERRVELTRSNILALGASESEAQAWATLLIALLRGLSIDLLATGDRERVQAAIDVAVMDAERRRRERWDGTAQRTV